MQTKKSNEERKKREYGEGNAARIIKMRKQIFVQQSVYQFQ